MAKLFVTDKDGNQTVHEMSGETIIGRDKGCPVRLSGDPKISRHHCKIDPRGKDFMLCDLNSANGTRWNGKNIGQQKVALNSGDLVSVGGAEIKFQAGGAAEGANRLVDRLAGFFDRMFSRGGPAKGEVVFGEKTVTCSCGTVLSTASKSPGQKVGCPRCRRVYVVPQK